ncbi:glyoxalase/bleomycin resistance protein/dioxygenase [Novosphingobium sp. Rr 2-17]|uniref:VOC family protein n=1 Tax=Novosphingobium sp. Rr 2-17 TaxID=555793 RepID=UPI000269A849|nr:VOC family protein [Novosphingobium sp. Rr 2-17]EIZ78540.1 glyoxalase/bleomycin resistance protein/dioxygenase [Novosphingobium sp. Rr 2-17]
MSIARAYDVAHVRFTVPDIDVMRRFLLDFGMIEVESGNPDKLYMRGEGRAPFLHASEKGEAGFAALGIWVRDRADLEALAAHDGVKVEELDAPGGGYVVRLRDPDGFLIEAIAEQELHTVVAYEPKAEPWNYEREYPRVAKFRRVAKGASHVQRLGHCVFGVTNFRTSEAWYKERFGFVTSDEIQPVPEVAIGAFMRCDRGDEPCDHHTIFLLERPGAPPEFMHSAFEVLNLDDLMAGHDYLKHAGHQTKWGIGRHILGSQVFDYWMDPYGHEIEHWTDGDQLRTADGGGIGSIDELLGVQWGPDMPNRPTIGEPQPVG